MLNPSYSGDDDWTPPNLYMHRKQQRSPSMLLRALRMVLSTLCRIILIIVAVVFAITMFIFILGVASASAALYGVLILLTGNGILRINFDHYTSNAGASQIGALGGVLGGICIGIITSTWDYYCSRTDVSERRHRFRWISSVLAVVLFGTLAGSIGAAILINSHNPNVKSSTDILHATRAGALGGFILAPAVIYLISPVISVLITILSPVEDFTLRVLDWFYTRSIRDTPVILDKWDQESRGDESVRTYLNNIYKQDGSSVY